MNNTRQLLSFLVTGMVALNALAADAPNRPLQVLYLGETSMGGGARGGGFGGGRTNYVYLPGQTLAPEAIYFNHRADATNLTASYLKHFDAVVQVMPDAEVGAAQQKLLDSFKSGGGALIKYADGNRPADSVLREAVLGGVSKKVKADWEASLAARPTLQRLAGEVPNYERRAEPVKYQAPLSPADSMRYTQVPADFSLQLFVAEPDIVKPIYMAWDERGRAWVVEARDYPHGIAPEGEPGQDSIKICEDTNGDGRADKFTVFADKLNLATSLAFVDGGVMVSVARQMVFLKDTDGDDKADVRKEIMTGWGIGDTHAQANNLHYGYDNWLYGCVGYSGFNGEIGGDMKRFAQGTYRFKADGSALEFLHQFSNNSWGHSANEAGDQFGGTANGAPLFYGGIPASAAPKGVRVMTAKKINVEDKCHTITPNFRQVDVMGGYTAAAGSAFIYSANMPARLQGMAMVCEPTMKNIALMNVQPTGAGYTAKDGFNLVASSDEWMSPVFAEVGPDGSVWFADWQNFIIQHNPTPNVRSGGYDAKTGVGGAHENPLRDHARGRIYRVIWEKAQKPAITSLKGASTGDLVKALSNDNPLWRLAAQRLLVEGKKTEATEELKQLVTNKEPAISAVHALWTLHGLGKLDDETHKTALLAKSSALRRNATRALGNDDKAKSLFFSAGVVSDPDLITRKAAMVKLADFQTTTEIQTVVASLAKKPEHRTDEWLNEATRLLVKKHKAEAYKEGPNLLPNPGFETAGADGLPEGWKRRDYGGRPANSGAEWSIVSGPTQFHGGKNGVRCITRGDADTSLYADVELKPNTLYRLSGWVKGRGGLRGKISFNDHLGRAETERVTRDGDWTYVEVDYNSGKMTKSSINILHVARGDGYFDDVKLCELVSADEVAAQNLVGDVKRGEHIFHKHVAACVLCHQLKGQGSAVGPALDGIAARGTPEYIRESLLEPSKVMAKGFEGTGLSPMPPMGDIFNAQELADIQTFLQTLK